MCCSPRASIVFSRERSVWESEPALRLPRASIILIGCERNFTRNISPRSGKRNHKIDRRWLIPSLFRESSQYSLLFLRNLPVKHGEKGESAGYGNCGK